MGQVISAVCAAETAIITINAAAGIEANTRRTFELAGKAHLARFIAINKLDHDNVDFAELIESIQESFGPQCVPINVPCGAGARFHAVKSTLASHAGQNGSVVDPAAYGSTVMDIIAETDDELMERYLDGKELTADEVLGGVNKAIGSGALIPIVCLCAKSGIGVKELMDAVTDGRMAHFGTFNGNPLAMAGVRAIDTICTPEALAHAEALNYQALDRITEIIAEFQLPAQTVGMGVKGCITWATEPVRNYRDYKATDFEVAELSWLWSLNRGIITPPGLDEQWLISLAHGQAEIDKLVEDFRELAQALRA